MSGNCAPSGPGGRAAREAPLEPTLSVEPVAENTAGNSDAGATDAEGCDAGTYTLGEMQIGGHCGTAAFSMP